MKTLNKIFIFCFIITFCNAQENNATNTNNVSNKNYKQYDDLFDSINKKRVGLSSEKLNGTKNPFVGGKIIVTNDQNESNVSTNDSSNNSNYTLYGILSDMANINGKWYRKNDKINDYKLTHVYQNYVLLDNSGTSLKLELKKGNKNVIIKTN